MKKSMIFIIVVLLVLLIYLGFKDKKIYYLNLGDEMALGENSYGNYGYDLTVKDYLESKNLFEKYALYALEDNHTTDLIRDIKDNIKVKVGNSEKSIQNVLIKADLISVSMGNNDFMDYLTINDENSINDLYNKFDDSIVDFERLFKLLRTYCKEEIVFIGFYDKTHNEELTDFFKYVNNKMINLTNEYEIKYIDISDIFQDSLYKNEYPTKEEYKKIGDKIIKNIGFD